MCRAAAAWALHSTRRSAAWALAEASGRVREIAHVTAADIDLKTRRVWLHDGRTTNPRSGVLTDWGHDALKQHLCSTTGDPDGPLIFAEAGSADSARVTASQAITDVLTRAGLAGEPDVRPASVAAWTGAEILAETRQIDVVAHRLGMHSLDRTARFVGWDWAEAQL